jgi:hypothetical protein
VVSFGGSEVAAFGGGEAEVSAVATFRDALTVVTFRDAVTVVTFK